MAKEKINIVIDAVNKTKREFDRVNKGLTKIGRGAKTASKAVAGVGLAATGVAAALVIASKKSLEFVDNIGKTATRTGIATDFIQAFQQGAIEAGSSIEQAQKGLEKFSRSVGDASRGLKTQADIFKDLGVEITGSNGQLRGNTEILLDVADGIKALGSAAEKSTVLANLFGRSGMQFAQIFEGGSEGLNAFVEDFRKLGFIISEQGIRTSEKFNDVVSQVKASLFGLQNQIVVGAAPALLSMATALREFIVEQVAATGGIEDFGKQIAISVVEGARTATLAFAELANGLSVLLTPQISILNAFIRIKKFLKDPVFSGIEIIKRQDKINVEEVNNSFDKLVNKIQDGSFSLEEFAKSGEVNLTNLQNPLAVFIDNLENVKKTLQTTVVQSMKKFEDSIVEGLRNGKLEVKNFADFVVEQLLRVAIQQALIRPMTSLFAASPIGQLLNIPSADGGGYTGMGARAGGLDGKGGRLAMVHPQETISDHTKGQAIGGATINFNINTVDAGGFDELLTSRKGLITAMINNAMNNQGKMGVV